MPAVDPDSLTWLVQTPAGSVILPSKPYFAINDLFRQFTTLQRQAMYTLPRRMNQATSYRANYRDVVKV